MRISDWSSDVCSSDLLTRGPYVIDGHARARMRKILAEIQDGTFARQWIAEYQSGNANYKALKQADLEHPIEATGRKLRAAMPWLDTAPTTAARDRKSTRLNSSH